MPDVFDYSSRRGAIVPLLPLVHDVMKENAAKDKLRAMEPPVGIVTFRQNMGPMLLDINRRFLFAMEKKGEHRNVVGFLFYRYGEGNRVYIEDMELAWKYRGDGATVLALLAKLEFDQRVKEGDFFGSERLKKPSDKEILADVGFHESFPDGWEPLGPLKDAINALRLRYSR